MYYFIAGLLGSILGGCLIKYLTERKWNKIRKRWDDWQKDKLVKLCHYERTYRFLKTPIGEGKEILSATFDGGKKWYQVSLEEDGLTIHVSPDQNAIPIVTKDIVIKESIRSGILSGRINMG